MMNKLRLTAAGITKKNLLWTGISTVLILVILAGAYQFINDRPHVDDGNICIRYQELLGNSRYSAFSHKICTLSLEKVSTEAALEKGLSGRVSMPQNHGMLFVFDQIGRQCFWMKDMNFNLDIAWLNAKGDVVQLAKNLSPATYPSQYCAKDTSFVIEVNAGMAKRSGLSVGSHVDL